jgi:hypothetical protein
MAINAATSGAAQSRQTIEELTARYHALHKKQIQAETELQSSKEQLDKLRQKALTEFGTDDVDELKAQLKALQDENEARRAKYQQDLDKIETDLTAVETSAAGEEAASDEKNA